MESNTPIEQVNVPETVEEEELDLGEDLEPLPETAEEPQKPTEPTQVEDKITQNTNETEEVAANTAELEPLDLGEDDIEPPQQTNETAAAIDTKNDLEEELDLGGDEDVVEDEKPEQSESNATSQPETTEDAQKEELDLGDDLDLGEDSPAPAEAAATTEQPKTAEPTPIDEDEVLDLGDDDDVNALELAAANAVTAMETELTEQTEQTQPENKEETQQPDNITTKEDAEAAESARQAADLAALVAEDDDVNMTSASKEEENAQEDGDVTMTEAKNTSGDEPEVDAETAQLDKELEALIDKSDAGSEVSFSSDSDVEVKDSEIYGLDDDDYEEPAERNRLRKRKAPKSPIVERPAKKGKVEEENLSPEKQAAKEFDELTKRARQKSATDIGDTAITSICSEMSVLMEDACVADMECNKAGELAINKLALLPRVEHYLQKITVWHDAMVNHGILQRLSEWLCPLPDGSLPNLKVRTVILKALRSFGEEVIDKDSLASSGLGRKVNYLTKSSKETKANKVIAAGLIRKWSKIVFNINSSYRGAYGENSAFVPNPQSGVTPSGFRRGSKMVQFSPHHASVPEKSAFDYTTAPETKPSLKGRRGTKRTPSRLASMGISGKKNKDSSRHVTMSINK